MACLKREIKKRKDKDRFNANIASLRIACVASLCNRSKTGTLVALARESLVLGYQSMSSETLQTFVALQLQKRKKKEKKRERSKNR